MTGCTPRALLKSGCRRHCTAFFRERMRGGTRVLLRPFGVSRFRSRVRPHDRWARRTRQRRQTVLTRKRSRAISACGGPLIANLWGTLRTNRVIEAMAGRLNSPLLQRSGTCCGGEIARTTLGVRDAAWPARARASRAARARMAGDRSRARRIRVVARERESRSKSRASRSAAASTAWIVWRTVVGGGGGGGGAECIDRLQDRPRNSLLTAGRTAYDPQASALRDCCRSRRSLQFLFSHQGRPDAFHVSDAHQGVLPQGQIVPIRGRDCSTMAPRA